MTGKFTQANFEDLSQLHSGIGVYFHVFLPSGERRFHNGIGRDVTTRLHGSTIIEETWEGVTNPFGGAAVEFGEIEEVKFGAAPYLDLTMSGAERAFLKEVWDDRHAIEGSRCDVYVRAIDAEEGTQVMSLKRVLPGKLTAIKIKMTGSAIRQITCRVVSVFEGMNFPASRVDWSPAGQRQRYPGDLGLDEIGTKIVEVLKI